MSGADLYRGHAGRTQGETLVSPNFQFPLRVDCNGYRPVYKLGNEGGDCRFGCRFCGVGRSPQVTSAANIALFDALHAKHLAELTGSYHPAVFNRGNVTDPEAFSLDTLNHILEVFEQDGRVSYLSLNSRESTAATEVLDRLAARNLPFPIHFIFGQESFSQSAPRILGKSNRGEMERFVRKLKRYNMGRRLGGDRKAYVFGLDVNLVFLPELYLEMGESREGREAKIAEGLANDVRKLLGHIDPLVPLEMNLHPYYEVAPLPYKRADVCQLLRILPPLQVIVDEHNRKPAAHSTHLFVGVVFFEDGGEQPSASDRARKLHWLQQTVDEFNRTGDIPGI